MQVQPPTLTTRLLLIQSVAAEPCLHPTEHAEFVANLIDAEDAEYVAWTLNALNMNTAREAVAFEISLSVNDLDLDGYGARRDHRTGVWDYTGRYEAAVERVTDEASNRFLAIVRHAIGRDVSEQSPENIAALAARRAAYDAPRLEFAA